MNAKVLSHLVFLLAMVLFGCERSQARVMEPMVLFVPQQALLTRGGNALRPEVGARIQPGDVVYAGLGGMDIQFAEDSVVRLRKFGSLKLLKHDKSGTRFELKEGSLIMRVGRVSRGQVVELAMPTAVLRVLGTTFSAQLREKGDPQIRVYQGRVAVVPGEISDPNRRHLLKLMAEKEIILEAGQSATMAPGFRIALKNLRLASAQEKPGGREARRDFAQAAGLPAAFTVENIPAGSRGERERATLVSLKDAFFQEDGADRSTRINEAYHRALGLAVQRIRAEARGKRQRSRRELLRVYGLLELVHQAEAPTVTGIVFADAGHLLLMETDTGIRKLEKDKITFVEFVRETK